MISNYFLRNKSLYTALLISILYASCSGDGTDNSSIIDSSNPSVLKISDKIYSIPSPIQFASLIKDGGAVYDASLLNNDNKQYLDNTSRALNMGVYGADLSYAIIYDQTQDAYKYLQAIKQLATPLDLDGVFDEKTLKRFQKNIGKTDSLYSIISTAYLLGDAHLKDGGRTEISALILAGSWIESTYLATRLFKLFPSEILKNRIAQQKLSLENIIGSLQQTGENEELIVELVSLSKIYNSINYRYTYLESTTDPENKITTINSETVIEMTSEQMEGITLKIDSIRNKIIKE